MRRTTSRHVAADLGGRHAHKRALTVQKLVHHVEGRDKNLFGTQNDAHHMTKRLKQRMAKKRVMKSTSQMGDCRQNLTM